MKAEAAATSRSMVMAPMTRLTQARPVTTPALAAPSSFRVLQVSRSPAQLSLFQRPFTGR
jgi:hypothetical protein